jgi:hypothetical protein
LVVHLDIEGDLVWVESNEYRIQVDEIIADRVDKVKNQKKLQEKEDPGAS